MSNYDSRQSTQGGTFVNLMRDSGFKAVYADRDNKQLLIELLNFFLPEDVKVSDIKAYLDREQDPEVESGKRTYLDLVCQGEDGRYFFSGSAARRRKVDFRTMHVLWLRYLS